MYPFRARSLVRVGHFTDHVVSLVVVVAVYNGPWRLRRRLRRRLRWRWLRSRPVDLVQACAALRIVGGNKAVIGQQLRG